MSETFNHLINHCCLEQSSKLRSLQSSNIFLGIALSFFLQSPVFSYSNSSEQQDNNSVSLEFIGKAFEKDFDNFGKLNVNAVFSGFGLRQTNPDSSNTKNIADLSNGMMIIEQNNGPISLFAQIGYYDILDIGQPDQRASQQTTSTFGFVPAAYLGYKPSKNWSISIGKLPALGGYESSFSYQNLNIERGVLWSQTSSFSEGLQIDFNEGPFTAAFAWTDGFYSNKFNWLGAQLSYQADQYQKISLVWTGAISANNFTNTNTPLLKNNSHIYNLIYKLEIKNWSFVPYLQYTYMPAKPEIGIPASAQTSGVALLVNYKFNTNLDAEGKAYQKISLPFRIEYIQASGIQGSDTPNLLYGPGSSAFTFTITPTLQYQKYFARVELSMIKLNDFAAQQGFGIDRQKQSQLRGLFEFGILF
jgi:hypothetical protein